MTRLTAPTLRILAIPLFALSLAPIAARADVVAKAASPDGRKKSDLQREMDVTFRLFDDGVAFRYTLPDQPNLHHANIAEELTQFAFAQPGTAWWKPAFEWNREEYLYDKTPLDAVGTAQTVMTVKLASGTHVALHEAALVDYSAMNLAPPKSRAMRVSRRPGAPSPSPTMRRAST